MRNNISKFQIYEEPIKDKLWANYASENVLMMTHPEIKHTVDLTDPLMEYISTHKPSLSSKDGGRTPLLNWLKTNNAVRQIDYDYITWKLGGTGKVKAIGMENLHSDDPTPGKGREIFEIVLDMETYVIGDVLAPDVAKEFQVVIEELPESYGQYYKYVVKNIDTNDHAYFPPELLAPGVKWCKIGSSYGESSKDYGSVQFQGKSWIEFETNMHDTGKEVKVTNKAQKLSAKIGVRTLDDKGRDVYKPQIANLYEAQMLQEGFYEQEKTVYYGRSGGRNYIDKSSGFHRRFTPGIIEFLEDGNVIPYPINGGGIDMLTETAQRLWFDRVPYKDRVVVYGTGQGGLTQANEWINAKYGGSSIQSDFNTFIGKGGKTYGEGYEGLVYKTAYFTEIQMFPFGRIRFEHWEHLDNTEMNGSLLHPETGLPLSSYEYIALDQGTGNMGGSNIEMLEQTDSEILAYECGTWTPLGPLNKSRGNFHSSGGERAYWLRWGKTYGARVKDITLGIWFKPAVTY